MKISTRLSTVLLNIILIFTLSAVPAAASASPSTEAGSASQGNVLSYNAGTDLEHPAIVNSQVINGERYLFLPSSANLSRLVLSFPGEKGMIIVNDQVINIRSGEEFDFAALFPEAPADGKYITRFVISGNVYLVNVMHSGAVRSLYITSSDLSKGHLYIDAVKGNKAKDNEIVLLAADGSCIYDGVMKEIKGRGNSTWLYPKKPYQFKLNEKADLLGAGKDERAKTWILLANYYDNSLFRNTLTNDLAAAIGLKYSHNCEFVDLYYDGEYCGCYLLSEKTEIDSARIDIRDLEGDIEDVNGDIDFDELNTSIVKNSRGNTMQVVEGVALPDDYSGGYLLEIDYAQRAAVEKSWFCTTRDQYVVSKSPEYLPAEAMEYVSGLYQDFEDAVYNGGIHPVSGKSYTEYVDLESLVMSYLLLTLSQNGDAFLSSTYFYIPENEAKLYAGPVWDFDTAYGLYHDSDKVGMVSARAELALKLMQIESFREAVAELWDNRLGDIIAQTVLSPFETTSADGVSSIAAYAAQCRRSQMMDAVRWYHSGSYSNSVDAMYSFMQKSYDWVENVLTAPNLPASKFVDVAPDSWYADAVNYVAGNGYFSGTSNITFSPDGQMTRAMLVTVLHRMAGSPDVSGACSYTDVSPDSFYFKAVLWAESLGLTTGYGNGLFGSDDYVTREQMMVFLYRFSLLSGKDISPVEISDEFCDKAKVSDWAEDALGWAISEDIINGVGGDIPTLAPQDTATRAMTATIVYRYDNLF